MLGQIYAIVILLTVLLSSGVASIATYTKVHSVQLRSTQVSEVLQDARDQLLSSVQSQVQGGAAASQVAAPSYTPLNLCPGQTTCPLTATVTFTQTGATGASASGTPINTYNANATLSEGRVAFSILASVTRSGVALASRTARFTYATFRAAPWAVEADSLYTSGASTVPNQGDRMGCDPSAAAGSCVSSTDTSSAVPGDTRTHVNAQCTGDPTECGWASTSSYKPADNFQNVTWFSTDANQ